MNGQLSQGYLQDSFRKRPSPALAADDSDDVMRRSEGRKVPKLIHDEGDDDPVDFWRETNNGDSDALGLSSSSSVLDVEKDNSTYIADEDTMTDSMQEETDSTCCFGMVRKMST